MESYLKSYPDQFNVVVCQNDNEAYGAIDAMKAAGVTYGVGGDVILISFDATKQGLTLTLNGEINCNVECNPLQAQGVADLIAKLEAGEEVPAVTYVPDSVVRRGRHRVRAGHHHDPGSAGTAAPTKKRPYRGIRGLT